MTDWFRQFSATVSGGVVVLGFLCTFLFIWLPREFDHINRTLADVEEISLAAASSSKQSAEFAERTNTDMEILIEEFTLASARPVSSADWVSIQRSLPADIFEQMKLVGMEKKLLTSRYGGTQVLYFERRAINQLSFVMKEGAQKSLEAAGWDVREVDVLPESETFRDSWTERDVIEGNGTIKHLLEPSETTKPTE